MTRISIGHSTSHNIVIPAQAGIQLFLVSRRRRSWILRFRGNDVGGAMDSFDLLIVGGGINGARSRATRRGAGFDVLLVEKDDLASHTSSASSKLIHGGLRYLEQYEFRLVRESLHERAILLSTAPHLVRPLKFVLPDPPGGRPFWLLRLGLLLYDLLSRRDELPRSRREKAPDPALRPGFTRASYYVDVNLLADRREAADEIDVGFAVTIAVPVAEADQSLKLGAHARLLVRPRARRHRPDARPDGSAPPGSL